ncbi:15-hydroxyprostaglandin dehydrogenase [Amniculicola lignicola CBS 123094]|uniref:15-hydroxyprostaglandin dehydrogenase n=1 Tax=Amniculicola lignicola CBS 123094 TaxID=1392246 RepID=A0A6A5X5N6_9PLEO|nr:15-hydroxyprostaglandin dehydrogenase [Amniculicola lignicola CBS 123094]
MGLAVATSLSKQSNWEIHILDLSKNGQTVASSLNATFHQSNVTDYQSLQSIFATIYAKAQRIDFVFANAGIAEHANFFDEKTDEEIEGKGVTGPKGMDAIIDINIKGAINTTYLALHYMRKPNSPDSGVDKSIVITASCGGLYPSYYSPIYTASKHAMVGFMRSVAPYFYHKAGIRVNAICPGTVKTNLLSSEEWESFPQEYFTPVEKIVETVELLISPGKEEEKEGVMFGKAVEISGTKHYYRQAVPFCDEGMKTVMSATNVEVQKGS